MAMIRRLALNMLKKDPSKMSIKRKRFKAMLNTTWAPSSALGFEASERELAMEA